MRRLSFSEAPKMCFLMLSMSFLAARLRSLFFCHSNFLRLHQIFNNKSFIMNDKIMRVRCALTHTKVAIVKTFNVLSTGEMVYNISFYCWLRLLL